jgi:hypothetical protein
LASRSRFLPWYRAAKTALGDLLKDLSDVDVMEYVSDDRLLTVPLSEGDREKRPLPVIEVEEIRERLSVSLVYRDAESLRHLRNILHPTQVEAQGAFDATMRLLPVSFETRLSKRGFKESSFALQKKYVASRVDAPMLSRLIDEAEVIRSGGRRTSSGRSVYEAPASPVLQVVYAQIKSDEGELRKTLLDMKPVITLLSAVRTQREIIHSSLAKPVDEAAKYRGFIELLNRARYFGVLSAEERRELDKKWRETPDERGPIEEDLRRRLGEST